MIQKLFDGILTRSIKLNSEEADMPDREQYTVSVLEQYMLSLSHGYEDQPQHIEVDIILTQQDKKQLCYIKHRLQLVSRLVKTYSSIDLDWKNIANSSCTQGPAVHTIKLTKSFNA